MRLFIASALLFCASPLLGQDTFSEKSRFSTKMSELKKSLNNRYQQDLETPWQDELTQNSSQRQPSQLGQQSKKLDTFSLAPAPKSTPPKVQVQATPKPTSPPIDITSTKAQRIRRVPPNIGLNTSPQPQAKRQRRSLDERYNSLKEQTISKDPSQAKKKLDVKIDASKAQAREAQPSQNIKGTPIKGLNN